MIIIKDYYGGKETAYGPYEGAHFKCINQSIPAVKEPTVTYSVTEADESMHEITVSLIHVIESATK